MSLKSLFDKWFELVFFFISFGIICGLFFSTAVSSLFSVLLLVLGIVHTWLHKQVKVSNKWIFILFCSPVFFYILGLIYSSNLSYGLKVITKSLSLVILPVAFLLLPPIKKGNIERIGYGLCLMALLSILVSLYPGLSFLNSFANFNNGVGHFDLRNLKGPDNIQSTYWAAFIGFAIIFLTLQVLGNKCLSRGSSVVHILGIAFFLFVITMLSTRIVLLGLILFLTTGLLSWGYREKRIPAVLLILVVGFFALAFIIYTNPNLKVRVKEAINYKSEFDVDKQWGGRAIRILKWKCSLSVIGDNFLLGVGTGDGQDELQKCYTERDYRALIFWPDQKYNAHNQFLQIMLSNGLFAFLFLGISLALPFVLSWKKREYLYISFLLFFCFICLTESFLLRNKGIVFFSYFNSLLFSGLINLEPKGSIS